MSLWINSRRQNKFMTNHRNLADRLIQDDILNQSIDKQKLSLNPIYMPKEIQCPECRKRGRSGTLSLLTESEMQKLKAKSGKDKYPDRIFGCDECQYWCDEEWLKELEN